MLRANFRYRLMSNGAGKFLSPNWIPVYAHGPFDKLVANARLYDQTMPFGPFVLDGVMYVTTPDNEIFTPPTLNIQQYDANGPICQANPLKRKNQAANLHPFGEYGFRSYVKKPVTVLPAFMVENEHFDMFQYMNGGNTNSIEEMDCTPSTVVDVAENNSLTLANRQIGEVQDRLVSAQKNLTNLRNTEFALRQGAELNPLNTDIERQLRFVGDQIANATAESIAAAKDLSDLQARVRVLEQDIAQHNSGTLPQQVLVPSQQQAPQPPPPMQQQQPAPQLRYSDPPSTSGLSQAGGSTGALDPQQVEAMTSTVINNTPDSGSESVPDPAGQDEVVITSASDDNRPSPQFLSGVASDDYLDNVGTQPLEDEEVVEILEEDL